MDSIGGNLAFLFPKGMDLSFCGWKEVSHQTDTWALSPLTTLVTFLSTKHTHFWGKGHQEGLPADWRWKLGAQVQPTVVKARE